MTLKQPSDGSTAIALSLRSRLVKDSISSMLISAGFSVLHESGQRDIHAVLIIDFDDCKDPELMGAHQLRGVKIVVLANEADSLELDPREVAQLSGILTHDLSADAFVQCLRLICAGERVFPRGLASGQKLRAPLSSTKPRSGRDRLSPREREVLAHVLEGHSNKMIARHLGMAEATVKVHLKSVLRKIRVENRTQAAIWALSNPSELAQPRAAMSELQPPRAISGDRGLSAIASPAAQTESPRRR